MASDTICACYVDLLPEHALLSEHAFILSTTASWTAEVFYVHQL